MKCESVKFTQKLAKMARALAIQTGKSKICATNARVAVLASQLT
jgi:hypothetical protein